VVDIRVTLNSNTASRVAIQPANDPKSVRVVSSGGGGGSGSDFDPTAVYSYANNIWDEANAAFNKANSANIVASAGFGIANTANVRGNLAQIVANAAYGQANVATSLAQNAYQQANVGFLQANLVYDVVNAAFVVANTGNLYSNLAFRAANAAYDFANTINIKVDAISIVANTGNLYANLAFRAANGAFDKANAANSLALSAFITANVANDRANLAQMASNAAYDFANTINIKTDASFSVANNANVYSNLAFRAANAAYDFANVINSNVDYVLPVANASFSVANNANARANLAQMASNAAYDFANSINSIARSAYDAANIANLIPVGNTMANGYFAVRSTRHRLNFVPATSNVSIRIDDDSVGDRINVVIDTVAGSGGSGTSMNLTAANVLANGFIITRTAPYANINFIPDTLLDFDVKDDPTHFAINVTARSSSAPFAQSNIALLTASTAYDKANAANSLALSAFITANTANDRGNLAQMASNAAYNFANTINIKVDAISIVANNANVYANLAFRAANAAYDFANAINAKVDYVLPVANAALVQANVANTRTVSNTLANGYVIIRSSARSKLNFIPGTDITIGVDDDSAGDRVNITITSTSSSGASPGQVFDAANAAFAVANNANLYANLAFRAANAVYDFANTININVAATMLVANNANVYANLAFRAANAAYDFANTININVAATMLVANNANVYANLAFRAANAAYDFANAINIKVDTTGNALSNVANTYSNGYVVLQSSRGTLNFMADTTDIKIRVQDNATHGLTNVRFDAPGIGAAYGLANSANLLANQVSAVAQTYSNGYVVQMSTRGTINFMADTTDIKILVHDNATHGLINVRFDAPGIGAAYGVANSAKTEADAVFGVANAHNGAMAQMNSAIFAVANNANLYANLAFRAANAAYDFANTININVAATMLVANNANVYANLAFRAANAVYDFANTININVAATMLVANNANVYANLAFRAANAAFDLTNLKYDKAGGVVSGNVAIRQPRVDNPSNVALDIASDWANTGQTFVLLRANIANIDNAHANSLFIQLQANNVTKFNVTTQGNVYANVVSALDLVATNNVFAPLAATIGAAIVSGLNVQPAIVAAYGVANNANLYANLAFRAANAVYDFANTININVAATMLVANNANVYANLAFRAANAAYDFANTININVAATMLVANNANVYANLAFRAANAAYDFANAINIKVDTTGNAISNVANTYSNGYVVAQSSRGTLNFMADTTDIKIRIQDNATHGLTNVRFDAPGIGAAYGLANSANILANQLSAVAQTYSNGYVIQISTRGTINFMADTTDIKILVHDNATHGLVNVRFDAPGIGAAYTQANAAKTEADAVFGVANVHNAAMAQMNTAIFAVANNANLYANLAFMAANAAYSFANTININVAATMLVANNANVYANLAFRAANAAYDFANAINIKVDTTGNALSNVANTYSNGYVVLQSSRGTLNFMADTTDIKIRIQDNATHGLTNVRFDAPGIGSAYGLANSANILANQLSAVAQTYSNGYVIQMSTRGTINFMADTTDIKISVQDNATHGLVNVRFDAPGIGAAYTQANAAKTEADAVFGVANVHNAAMAQMNTAIFAVANNANLYANLAFMAANAAYSFANTININVAATMLVANNANVYANLAFRAANAVYDFANVININVAATMLMANFANILANQVSNVAQTFSNGYVVLMSSRGTLNFMADTTDLKIRVHDNATHGLVNVRFDAPGIGAAYAQSNIAMLTSSTAYDKANLANQLANGAFLQANVANTITVANTLSNGFVIIRSSARSKLNFIPGSNMTISVDDDSAGDRVNITLTAATGGPGGAGMNLTAGNTLFANGYYSTRSSAFANINFMDDSIGLLRWNIADDAAQFRINVSPIITPVFVSDSPPATPVANTLWWEANTGALLLYYADANSSQWVEIGGLSAGLDREEVLTFAISDEFSQLISGANRFTYHFMKQFNVLEVNASLSQNGSSNTFVDVNKNGTSIFSANLNLFGANAHTINFGTSALSSSPITFNKGDKMNVNVGSAGVSASGLKLHFRGFWN
jgi:hypothetical protein